MKSIKNGLLAVLLITSVNSAHAYYDKAGVATGLLQGAARGALFIPEGVIGGLQWATQKAEHATHELITAVNSMSPYGRTEMSTLVYYGMTVASFVVASRMMEKGFSNLVKNRILHRDTATALCVAGLVAGLGAGIKAIYNGGK